MKRKQHDYLVRNFLISLLQSNLSDRDLSELAADLQFNSDFQKSIGILLEDTLRNFRYSSSFKEPVVKYPKDKIFDPPDSIIDLIQKLASQKKMSKDRMLNRMRKVDPKLSVIESVRHGTLRDLISYFVETHSSASAKELLNSIGASSADEGDAYLTGITQRRTF